MSATKVELTGKQQPTLTPSGMPRMGSRFDVPDGDGALFVVEVVGRLYGRKGVSDCIGVILEDVERGGRIAFDWPLVPA